MDLLLIGGVSGSGKNVALGALEDSGYYAVNNLPLPLVEATASYLAQAGRNRVAIAIDAKIAPGLAGLAETIERLRALTWNVRFLYLDAKTETLVKRFSETRRRHPFSSGERTLTEAIDYERGLLVDARPLGFTFDTSDTSSVALRSWIKDFVSVDAGKLTLQLESFGFKHGVPLDADLVFDVRCLPNPNYDPRLQPLTGRDRPVVEFLGSDSLTRKMLEDIQRFVADWLPAFDRDNRSYLTVAIGCTGGRHRSVYLAECLAAAFAPKWRVLVRHRHLAVEDGK
jgi:UPF0042 nucleotide-binding protein